MISHQVNPPLKPHATTDSVNLAPMVLSFFAEKGKSSRQEVTHAVYNMVNRLQKQNIQVDAVFRGNFEGEQNTITSESVDNEIHYWVSHQFLKECYQPHSGEDLCFDLNPDKKSIIDKYLIKNLVHTLQIYRWECSIGNDVFVNIMKEVISDSVAHECR